MGQSAAVGLGPEVLEATPEGGGHLIASRCEDCGAHYFPQRRACSRCLSESLERVALSGHGEIYTYSVIHQSTPAFAVPYILAYVDLPEQVRVAGQVVGFASDEIELGTTVELEVLPDGPTFRFRPST